MILTLLLDLPDLLHRLFEDGTFVRFDVEVVHVVDVSEYQLGQLLDVLVLLLPVPPLGVPLWAVKETSTLSASTPNIPPQLGKKITQPDHHQARNENIWLFLGAAFSICIQVEYFLE